VRRSCGENRVTSGSAARSETASPERSVGVADRLSGIANPLREGLRLARVPQPATLVLFGGSGDLARRKLLPALYNLALQRLLPASFAVVGAARSAQTDAEFRQELHDAVASFSRTKPINEEV